MQKVPWYNPTLLKSMVNINCSAICLLFGSNTLAYGPSCVRSGICKIGQKRELFFIITQGIARCNYRFFWLSSDDLANS